MKRVQQQMIKDIQRIAAASADETGRRQLSARVMRAMAKVPREVFVPEEQQQQAYADSPLPIGHRQTISQPFMVALMSDLLEPQASHRVLEIGTGSGYQTAILSRLVKEVYSTEIIAALSRSAEQRLHKLNCTNVRCFVTDGYLGLDKYAPYDGIIVTAACPHPPPALLAQLKVGGKMVIPIDEVFSQILYVIERADDQHYQTSKTISVRFVPLTGALGN